jgi:hypothetical protein
MWMQVVNKDEMDRVWLNMTNTDGQTISAHYPVFKYVTSAIVASVNVNECGQAPRAAEANTGEGSFIGLAYEDIPNGSSGIVQVYGYHESALIYRIVGSVTVIPGGPLGPGNAAASVGLSSTGAVQGLLGPVVALDTVTATLHSLGTVNYTNHVFIRAL